MQSAVCGSDISADVMLLTEHVTNPQREMEQRIMLVYLTFRNRAS
jgi:hypothetical protein